MKQRPSESGCLLYVRFRKLDDVPLDVVGAAIARTSADAFIADYERSRNPA